MLIVRTNRAAANAYVCKNSAAGALSSKDVNRMGVSLAAVGTRVIRAVNLTASKTRDAIRVTPVTPVIPVYSTTSTVGVLIEEE